MRGDEKMLRLAMLIELCFQTAGLWQAGSDNIMALPHAIDSLKLYKQEFHGSEVYAEVRPHRCEDTMCCDARVVDNDGNVYLEIKNYRTVPLPYTVEADLIEPFKVLVNGDKAHL
jgi:hypothetical protein